MTAMYDGWSSTLEDLTARRFLTMHRDGRRCWQCEPDNTCRFLTWAVGYFTRTGQSVPDQAAIILARAVHPEQVTVTELREIAATLRARMVTG